MYVELYVVSWTRFFFPGDVLNKKEVVFVFSVY
jgi:hypothetical protein